MKIHFLLLALVAVVALSQHNVDARLHGPALERRLRWENGKYTPSRWTNNGKCYAGTKRVPCRRLTERNSLDELLLRRMEALEDDGEDYVEDGRDLFERRLRYISE